MKRDIPICFCSWIDEIPASHIQRLVEKADTEGLINLVFPKDRIQFQSAIIDWYAHSTNTQYLFITTHGIAPDGNVIGIGSQLDGDHHITWQDLWKLVVQRKHKPPNIHIMGCRVTEAVQEWNPLITRRMNTPYFVGYNQVVETVWDCRPIAKVLRLLLSFLRTTPPVLTLDQELAQVLALSATVDAYLPVCLKGQRPRFADARTFPATCGMDIRQYLDRRAEELANQ